MRDRKSSVSALRFVTEAIQENQKETGLLLILPEPFRSILMRKLADLILSTPATSETIAIHPKKCDNPTCTLGCREGTWPPEPAHTPLPFTSTHRALATARGVLADARRDLHEAPKDSVAFGHAEGMIEACHRIIDDLTEGGAGL